MAKVDLHDYLRQIDALVESGQATQAVACCQHVLQYFPQNVEAHRLLGQAYLEQGHTDQAADTFQRVLSADPEDFTAHTALAAIHQEGGRLADAVWHLERAYELQPHQAAIQQDLRRLYARRGGPTPERLALTRGALARVYFQGELYDQAIAEADHILAEDSERVDLQGLLAEALWRDHQRLRAAEVCQDLLGKLPNSITANALLAEANLLAGQAEEAAIYLHQLQLLVQPDVAHPDGRLARLYDLAEAPPWPEQVLLDEWVEGTTLEEMPPASAARPDSLESWLAHQSLEVAGQEPLLVPAGDLSGDDDDVPEWLREALPVRPAGAAEEAAGKVPAWLAELGEPLAAGQEWLAGPSEPIVEPLAETRLPDWLLGLDAAQGTEWPAAGQELPTLADVRSNEEDSWRPLTNPSLDEAAAVTPGLARLPAEDGEGDLMANQEALTWWPAADKQTTPQVEVEVETGPWPDWLDTMATMLVKSSPPPAGDALDQPPARLGATEEKMLPLPDEQDSEEDAQEVENPTAWLDDLAAQKTSLAEFQTILGSPAAAEGPPDWLQKELEGEPASESYLDWLQPDQDSSPAEIPTWLEPPPDLTTGELPVWSPPAAESAEGTEPPPVEVGTGAMEAEAVLEDLSWLDQVAAGEGPAIEEPPTLTWLDEDTPEIPLGFVEAALPAAGDDLGWLDVVSLEAADVSQPVVSSAEIPEEPEAVLAWLEQLATLPEEPAVATPGYVEEAPPESRPPAVEDSWLPLTRPEEPILVETPVMGEDILEAMPEDPDEAMAWLERLAVQRETAVAEPELAPAAEVAVPDWLTLEEEAPAEAPMAIEVAPEMPVLALEAEAAASPEPEIALEIPPEVERQPETAAEPELQPEMAIELPAEGEAPVEVAAEPPPAAEVEPLLTLEVAAEPELQPEVIVEVAAEPEPVVAVALSAREQASQAMAAGQLDRALPLYEQWLNQGEDVSGLVAELETAVGQNQGQPLLRRLLGDAYLRNGQLQKALDTYRLVLEQL